VRARQRLQRWHDGELDLPADALERLVITATGDKDLANEYRIAALRAETNRKAANRTTGDSP